jgi:hypothetical protein
LRRKGFAFRGTSSRAPWSGSVTAERTTDEALANLPEEARRLVAANERAKAKEDVARYEDMLKNEPAKYWGNPANQQAYRQALERSLVETPVMPAVETQRAAVPAAAPATPTPVPTAVPPVATVSSPGEPALV